MDEKVEVLGINISNLSTSELNDAILRIVRNDSKEMVLHVNIHGMNTAHRLAWYRNLLNSARIVFCDGDGVRLGAAILGKKIKEKITYNRWLWEFASFSEKNNLSWYLIGSTDPIIQAAVQKLNELYPRLHIRGYRNGFFKHEDEVRATLNDISAKSVNILIVGMGMPVQEKWLVDNWEGLKINAALTGGAVFEYVSGAAKMTPHFMFTLKLEWLYRFLQEPKRLFKRYFIGNPAFIMRALTKKIAAKKSKDQSN